jgi:two-component system response regulator NreC
MKSILASHPGIKTVMLTFQDSDDMMIMAFTCGARGYLLKSTPMTRLVVSLRAVERGELVVSQSTTSQSLDELVRFISERDHIHSNLNALTPREVEVLKLLGTRATNREISQQLCIAENTVKNHTRNIYEKLKLKNRDEAVKLARLAALTEFDTREI